MSKKRSMTAIVIILIIITGAVFLLNYKKSIPEPTVEERIPGYKGGEKNGPLALHKESALKVTKASMPSTKSQAQAEIRKNMNKKLKALSIPFIKNEGQTNSEVRYYAKTFGGTLFVTKKGELVYTLPKHEEKAKVNDKEKEGKFQTAVIKEEFVGAEINEVKTERESETKVSYFIGNDPNKHRSGISTYEIVSLGEIYKGIELKLKAYGNNVEKIFYLRPDAEPEDIKVGICGSRGIGVNEKGELIVKTVVGDVKFTKPVAYQEIDGKRVDVAVEYVVQNSEDTHQSAVVNQRQETDRISDHESPITDHGSHIYAFRVGHYDKTKELVIDPLLQSTYLGGSSYDNSYGIAIHPVTGDVYVTGHTDSNDFPGIAGGADTTFAGYSEAFVSRLNSGLTILYQSTYLGGSNDDLSCGIAIHPTTGDVYVTGWTLSDDFPKIAGGADTTFGGLSEAFVSRLNSGLTILYQSTYLGGSSGNEGYAIAIHPVTGDVYVTGETESSDFPQIAGGADTFFAGSTEAFISKLNSGLTILHQSSYLGGNVREGGHAIAIHPTTGDVYVIGSTLSDDFPNIAGGADTTFGGKSEAFVSRLNSGLTILYQSTYLGGSNYEHGNEIAIHPVTGNVYVTGDTVSNDFPHIAGGADTTFGGYSEAFVSRLNSGLTTLYQSTYLGGSSNDSGYAIAIHPTTGDVYVIGVTYSNDFPNIAGGSDSAFSNGEAFVSRLNSGLTILYQSTYLGGSSNDSGYAIAIHPTTGDLYVTGTTSSTDFPHIAGGADTTFAGSNEAFVSRLDNLNNGGILTANASGSGSGNVSSYPTGINYDYPSANSGSGHFVRDTDVVLTGRANSYCTASWSGTCAAEGGIEAGNGTAEATCTFNNLDSDKTATVTFTLKQYTVTANATGTGTGNVSSNPGGINYNYPANNTGTTTPLNHGTNVVLTAMASVGSTASWGGTCTWVGGIEAGNGTTEATCTLASLDGNKTCTANFTLHQYFLTVNKDGTGSGTITSNPSGINCGADCTELYNPGAAVNLSALPDTGSLFAGWSGGGCSGTGDCVITMNGDTSVTGTFNLSDAPDLSGAWSNISKRKIGTRSMVSGRLTVYNTGTKKASQATVRIYLSDNTTYDPSDQYLGYRTFTVNAGSSAYTIYNYFASTDPQGRYFIAVIDPDNKIKESREDNNIAVSSSIP